MGSVPVNWSSRKLVSRVLLSKLASSKGSNKFGGWGESFLATMLPAHSRYEGRLEI